MALENDLNNITKKLNFIFEKYISVPGFNHPLNPNLSPRRDNWKSKWPIGNVYRWHMHYETGDTGDTSGTLVRYMLDEEIPYQIIYGKPREPIDGDLKTSNFDEILKIFEETILKNIIAERPHKKN